MSGAKRFTALLAVILLAATACATAKGTPPAVVKEVKQQKIGTLAVLDFDAANVEKDLGAAVSELVRSEISAMEDLPYTVVERVMLNRVLKEQELAMSGIITDTKAVKIGKILYAEHLVMGRIVRAGNQYRVDGKIVETGTAIVKKQAYHDVRSREEIPEAARIVSYRLFDREYVHGRNTTVISSDANGFYATIYTDSRGIHRGGKIYLQREGDKFTGWTMEDIGKAAMEGTVSGEYLNGYYRARYGYGNFTFRVVEGGKYLVGTYYQVSNGAHGDWIGAKGEAFSLPPDLYTGKWKRGDRCLAKWSGDSWWYPGRVADVRDSMYLIKYDDGDSEWRLEMYLAGEDLKPGDTVFGKWKSGGRYYRGLVAERKGEELFIKYDDGDKEWTTVGRVRVMTP